ncbi:MAG: hypothetical protein J0L92_24405 [Deltaproteobacteria bacterium]|nr:hypothetical protein [Deltaproteobacteria bacterium]
MRSVPRSMFLVLVALAGCDGDTTADDAAVAMRDAQTPLTDALGLDAPGLDARRLEDAFTADAPVVEHDTNEPDAATRDLDAVVAELASCDPTRFDRALHEIAWSEGWPLEGEGRWLFATRLEGSVPSASLVGDLGDWDTTRWPATRCGDGSRFYVVIDEATTTSSPVGSKYKWYVARDDAYLVPPEATQYGYDEFGRFGWVRAPRDVAHLEQFPAFVSAHLSDPRAFRAYVPAGFEPHGTSARAARTLLLHDGQNVFHPDAFFGGWHVDEALAARGTDVIALAIDNAPDRMDAYTQVADDLGGGAIGGRADDYLALLEDEALPFFRARYGIVARGRSLMIAGSSLGGLVTLHAAQRDVASMGCGAAMSSTVGWGSIASSARGDTAIVETWRGVHAALYLDSGGGVTGACRDSDADGVQDDADDSDNYCVNLQLLDVLERAGYARGTSLTYAWQEGAPHNEAAWASRIGDALDACARMGWTSP